jgi:ADP-ribosylglycohydrolase
MTPLARVYAGVALGERLAWTGLYDRSFLYPFWTRRKRREIELSYEADRILSVSLPFALNQPVAAAHPGPGPHSEWVAFQARACPTGEAYALEPVLDHWRELVASRDALRLTIGQHAALHNLGAGKLPPVSGRDNPHYFDDSACFRALVLACRYANDVSALLENVAQDASITNAEDGVWAAQAVAAGVVAALAGAAADGCVAAAVRQLPEGSWSRRLAVGALRHAQESQTVFELVTELERDVVNHAYSYGNSAPEVLAAALAIVKFAQGNGEKALLAALALPRLAGSLAPLTGAFCAALGAVETTETDMVEPLRGVALGHLAGALPEAWVGPS